MPDYAPAAFDHFYSPETSVSLELPAGRWRKERSAPGTATFVHDPPGDADLAAAPRIDCRLFEVPDGQPDAFRHVADELVRMAGDSGTLVSQTDASIDNAPAVVSVVESELDGVGPITQQQALGQFGNVVLSVVATAGRDDAERFLPEFERAVGSIRIIAEDPA